MKLLKFAIGNAKLKAGEAVFDLPAGHTCPFALHCYAFADKKTGKIQDGPELQFRCFAASLEAAFTNVRQKRWHNYDLLRGKSAEQMTDLITKSIPDVKVVRIHASGDFFSLAYFDAWLAVARAFPDRLFYAYTKALPLWTKRLEVIPSNFILTASQGGTHDQLIKSHKLKSATVVTSAYRAKQLGLKLDHDDSLAKGPDSFALLIHGTQPAGTPAAKAWKRIKATTGVYSL